MWNLFLFVTGAIPGGTMGRLSTTECTYLPTLTYKAQGVKCLFHFGIFSMKENTSAHLNRAVCSSCWRQFIRVLSVWPPLMWTMVLRGCG